MSGNHVVVLTGGVGGAKLVEGLVAEIGGARVTAIVNTGDDFTHLGLPVSPDIDTLVYTLADLVDRDKGWGRRDEGWRFMAAVEALGGETWFQLGDADLAMHVVRGQRLAAGESLSAVTADLAARLGIEAAIVPMSDQPAGIALETDEGLLDFQHYFVGRRCAPRVHRVRLDRPASATPSEAALAALARPDLAAILVAPSNPWLSIDPMLALPGMCDAIRAAGAPVVAVTPLPGGKAVKGPTAKIMDELGIDRTVQAIVDHYGGLLDGLLADQDDPTPRDISVDHADTIMHGLEDKRRVARAALALAARLQE